MKVLFWTEAFWPTIGGIEVLASRLLPALRQRGHEFLVITDDDVGRLAAEDEFRSIAVRRLGLRAALLSRSPERIAAVQAATAELVQSFRPQLVHWNCPGLSGFFLRQTMRRLPVLEDGKIVGIVATATHTRRYIGIVRGEVENAADNTDRVQV